MFIVYHSVHLILRFLLTLFPHGHCQNEKMNHWNFPCWMPERLAVYSLVVAIDFLSIVLVVPVVELFVLVLSGCLDF